MHFEVFADVDTAARQAAAFVAQRAAAAVDARGRFLLAVSGGHTPWLMLRALAERPIAWPQVHVVQADERVAPAGDPDRNLTHLAESLLAHAPLPRDNVHAMPVDNPNLEAAAEDYARTLCAIAGTPPTLDLVHLGLGPDGHTASLVPGDAALEIRDRDVAITGEYQGRRRMTLTYPLLDRSRSVLWLVTGDSKRAMLERLLAADWAIPAGRVRQDRAVVFADRGAAGGATTSAAKPDKQS
jgi:6-phosphogluconolactonase